MAAVDEEVVRTLDFENGEEVNPDLSYHGVEQLLADLADSQFTYLKAIDQLTAEGADPQFELDRVKEHFSKLKFNFLELETKQGFLEGVQKVKPFRFKPDDVIANLEKAVSDGKAALKEHKKQSTEAKETIEAAINTLEEHRARFAAARAAVMDKIKTLPETAGDIETLKAERDGLTQEIEEASLNLRQVDTQASSLQDEVDQLEWEAAPLEVAVEQLKEDITATKKLREAAAKENVTDAVIKSRTEVRDWYAELVPLMKTVSGVTDVSFGEKNDMTVALEYQSSKVSVHITLESDSTRIASVTTTPSTIDVKDLVEATGDITNIGMFMREFKQRSINHSKRDAEVRELAKGYIVNDDGADVMVTLKCGVVCTFSTDADYPMPHTHPNVKKIVSPGVRSDIESIKANVNSGKFVTITAMVSELERAFTC